MLAAAQEALRGQRSPPAASQEQSWVHWGDRPPARMPTTPAKGWVPNGLRRCQFLGIARLCGPRRPSLTSLSMLWDITGSSTACTPVPLDGVVSHAALAMFAPMALQPPQWHQDTRAGE